MRAPALLLVALVALVGCGTTSFDEAYGRPDATRWTYFESPPARVINAIGEYYLRENLIVESADEVDGGVVLTLASRFGGASTAQIFVQATSLAGFSSRAQLYPRRRPLPRDLEQYVSVQN